MPVFTLRVGPTTTALRFITTAKSDFFSKALYQPPLKKQSCCNQKQIRLTPATFKLEQQTMKRNANIQNCFSLWTKTLVLCLFMSFEIPRDRSFCPKRKLTTQSTQETLWVGGIDNQKINPSRRDLAATLSCLISRLYRLVSIKLTQQSGASS